MKSVLLIIDFDGTLCATHAAISYCLKRSFELKGLAPPAESDIEQTIRSGIGLNDTMATLNSQLKDRPAAIEELVTTYRDIYNSGEGRRRTYLYPGVKNALIQLAEQGCLLVLVSNKGERAVQETLTAFEILSAFDLLVCDRADIPRKPHPDSYKKIIEPKYRDRQFLRTFVVGDTAADIRFAQNIGATSCWASYGYGNPQDCEALAPNLRIASFPELPPTVSQSVGGSTVRTVARQ